MSDETETESSQLETEVDKTITEVEAALDTDKPLTIAHLKDLEERINTRIDGVVSSSTATANERAELKAELKKVQDQLTEYIAAAEEKSKSHSDESTIIVPDDSLDISLNQNPVVSEETTITESGEERTKSWWKKLY